MADENPNQVLDYLREQFARVHARFDAIDIWRREAAAQAGHYASLSERLDNLADRVARIERRLDLVEEER